MRWAVVAVASLGLSISGTCFAQTPSGPSTLDNLLQDDKPTAATTEAIPPAVEDEARPVRPEGTYVRPKNGSADPDLDKAWAAYDAAVEKATAGLREAIGKQRMAAREAGDLDAAKQCKGMLEALERKGLLPADDKVMKKETEATKAAYQSAVDDLRKAYRAVVAKLVKDTTVDESVAEAVESELKALDQKSQSPAIQEKKGPQIPKDAIRIGKHSYYICTDRMTQQEAVAACQRAGGYLARITEPMELLELKKVLGPTRASVTFSVDGTDAAREGVWTFLNGQPMNLGTASNFKALPWLPGQPDGSGNGLALWWDNDRGEGAFGFDDISQKFERGFICEWDEVK